MKIILTALALNTGTRSIGAIGVSGANSAAQDEEVANTSARAIEETKPASE